MNERDMRMMYDGRNPYGSEGGYVVSSRGGRGRGRGRVRGRRGDRGMDYGIYPDMRGDMNYGDMARDGRRGGQGGRGRGDRGDYGYDMAGGGDMRTMDYRGSDYRSNEMRVDGHHYPEHQMGGQTYYPIEAMGRFNGYWGMPEQDFAGRGRDYGDMRAYNMSGRRSHGDYRYDDYGDYGETLSDKELDDWCHKLMSQLDEREKQMFNKDAIMQKIRSMGKSMDGFGEKELYLATIMCYTDFKEAIGANPDMALRLGYAWLSDKDVAVKGAQKLATYYDCIVEGAD